MVGEGKRKLPAGARRIKLGRLAVDPVFLIIFSFFALSSFLMALYIWLAL
ncbi:MAG: hypothetical protein FWC60_08445 [Firmicutes bacterium]|nr:hypothetical protein [Bacillota bacterium]